MIEVEKKFQITHQTIELLKSKSIFLNEITFSDTYFDNKDFVLTSNDKWLRKRNSKYELKTPIHKGLDRLTDQYEEIIEESEIKNYLNFLDNAPLYLILEKNGYLPFCSFTTTRQKYKNEKFNIDFDIANFSDFNYSILEIELMVQKANDIPSATKDIIDFAKKYCLELKPIIGKVAEYLKQKSPKHYQILIDKKIIKKI